MKEKEAVICRSCGTEMAYKVIGLGQRSYHHECPKCGHRTKARKIQQKKERSKHATGSLAHSQRIALAGTVWPKKEDARKPMVQSVKTIKYPASMRLRAGDDKTANQLAQAIQEDQIGLLGPMSEYGCYVVEKSGRLAYAIVDFWFDAVSEGAVFANSAARLLASILALSGVASAFRQALGSSPLAGDIYMAQAERFLGITRRVDPRNLARAIKGCFTEEERETIYSEKQVSDFASRIDAAREPQERLLVKLEIFGISEAPASQQWNNDAGLSVCLLPDATVPKHMRSDRLSALLYRLQDVKQRLNLEKDDDAFECLGIDPGALSNFLGRCGFLGRLMAGDINSLADNIMAMTPLWSGKRDELLGRLEQLKQRADHLYLREPHFGNFWNDHRSRLSGRVAGWFSGCLGKLQIALQQIPGVRQDLGLLIRMFDAVPASAPSSGFISQIRELDSLLEMARQGISPRSVCALCAFHERAFAARSIANRAVQRDDTQQWLKTELGAMEDRIEFNRVFPNFSDTGKKKSRKGEENSSEIQEDAPEDALGEEPESAVGSNGKSASEKQKRFQRVPRFFGEAARAEYQALDSAWQRFEMFCNNLRDIFRELNGQQRKAPRDFKNFLQNRLQKLFKQTFCKARSQWCRDLVGAILRSCGEFYANEKGEQKFKMREDVRSNSSDPEFVVNRTRDIALDLFSAVLAPRDYTPEERVDLVEIEKKAISFLLAVTQAKIAVGSYDWLNNETVARYLAVAGTDTLFGTQLEEFLNAAVLSQMHGLATRLSQKELKQGCDVQLEGGVQGNLQMRLVYRASSDTSACARATCPAGMDVAVINKMPAEEFVAYRFRTDEARAYMRHRPHSFGWQIRFSGAQEHAWNPDTALVFEKPTDSEPFSMKPFSADYGPVLWSATSAHQEQYLDWFISQPENRLAQVLFQAGSLRLEQNIALAWDLDAGAVRLEPAGAPAFYVPVPFSFSPSEGVDGYKPELLPNRYMGLFPSLEGVEYGIVDVPDSGGFKVIQRGVISVDGFKSSRVKGYVQAEIDAANRLHNQYTAIAIKFGARIVVQWAPPPKQGGTSSLESVYARATRPEAPRPGNQEDFGLMKSAWGRTWSTRWEKRGKDDVLPISTQVYWPGSIGEQEPAIAVALLGHIRATSTLAEWEKEEMRLGLLKKFFRS